MPSISPMTPTSSSRWAAACTRPSRKPRPNGARAKAEARKAKAEAKKEARPKAAPKARGKAKLTPEEVESARVEKARKKIAENLAKAKKQADEKASKLLEALEPLPSMIEAVESMIEPAVIEPAPIESAETDEEGPRANTPPGSGDESDDAPVNRA